MISPAQLMILIGVIVALEIAFATPIMIFSQLLAAGERVPGERRRGAMLEAAYLLGLKR